jgi:hypothetical protein
MSKILRFNNTADLSLFLFPEYNHIKSRRVEEAMRYVLRDHFIKPSFGDRMYNNVEKDLGYETFMESPNHVS